MQHMFIKNQDELFPSPGKMIKQTQTTLRTSKHLSSLRCSIYI